jgi:hypothetical protein
VIVLVLVVVLPTPRRLKLREATSGGLSSKVVGRGSRTFQRPQRSATA